MKRLNQKPRRGNIIILSCGLMVCLLALVALAVDVGYLAHAHTELQRTADAIALAAAARLPSQTDATDFGLGTAQSNDPVAATALDANDFEFGWWNRNDSTFTTPPPSNRQANAVRVTVGRTEAGGNPLNLFFARVIGHASADITCRAIAFMDRGLCGPFIGIEGLTAMGDINTDSFDSIEGPYVAALANHRGSLCSDGDITLNGGVYIKGDVRAGAGDDIIIHGSSGTVTGNIGNRVKPLDFPSVDTADVAGNNDNALLGGALNGQRNFRLNGGEVFNMPPGTYYLNNMDMMGMSVLNISGETVIYLTGDLMRAGGTQVNNNTQIASNLRIYSTGGRIDVTSHNPFYGVIYAPDSQVDIGGTADFFGAIVGQTLRVHGDATGHYDESLQLEEIDPPTRTTIVD